MLTQTKQFEKYGQGRVGARCVTLRYFFRRNPAQPCGCEIVIFLGKMHQHMRHEEGQKQVFCFSQS